jgi:hypothetical protein
MGSSAAVYGSQDEISPCHCAVSVVFFVPFLTGVHADEPPTDRTDSLHEQPRNDPSRDLLGDLRLWGYSDAVNDELRGSLPHRLTRTAAPVEQMPRLPESSWCVWRPEACSIDVWNVGAGLVTMTYRLCATDEATWAQIRASVTPRPAKEQVLAGAAGIVLSATAGTSPSVRTASPHFSAAGTPLWVQEMFVVRSRAPHTPEELDAVANDLTDGGEKLEPHGDGAPEVLRLGVEACAVSASSAAALTHSLGRVLAAQTAIWAAAIDMDRLLEGLLRTGGVEARTLALDALEVRSIELLDVYERTQQFRASIEVVPLHLGTPDKAVWTCVNRVWELGQQLTSIDMKLTAVEHVYTHLVTTMSAKLARTLNFVVLGVTSLSLATFLLTLWDFTQKRFDPFDWVSGLVALASSVIAAVLFYAAWNASSRKVPQWHGRR